MKNIQDNGKIKLCETDNMDHLVRLTQTLNENNIPYETRLKKATFINNLFFLIFYHTFASGIDHKNETTCIYVLEPHNQRHTVAHGDAERGWYIQTASCT